MKKIDKIFALFVLLWLSVLGYSAWDNTLPDDNSVWNDVAGMIRDNWDVLEIELGVDIDEAHPYYQTSAPSTKPDGSTALDADDTGRLWIDSADNVVYVLTSHSGPTWTSTSASPTITQSGDPNFTITNTDEEDGDFGRDSTFISRGEDSDGKVRVLGQIQFSHDGGSKDQKGQVTIKLNAGADGNSPANQAIGYTSDGFIDVGNSLSVIDDDSMGTASAVTVATSESVTAYADAAPAAQMTPASYAGEESITFPNGLIMKVKTTSGLATGATVTFGTAFPTAIINVVAVLDSTSTTANCTVDSPSTTIFKVYHNAGGTQKIHWIAIGY